MNGREKVLVWLAAASLVLLVMALGPLVLSRGPVVSLLASAARTPAAPGAAAPPPAGASYPARAQDVRRFIDPLIPQGRDTPAANLGREGFEPAEISHLRDVRRVFQLDLVLVLVGAAGAAFFVLRAGPGRRAAVAVSAAVRALTVASAASVVLALAGALAFPALFTAFHQVFFSGGNWQFPENSLLITLFPERFWAIAGGAWVVLTLFILAAAAVIAALGRAAFATRDAAP